MKKMALMIMSLLLVLALGMASAVELVPANEVNHAAPPMTGSQYPDGRIWMIGNYLFKEYSEEGLYQIQIPDDVNEYTCHMMERMVGQHPQILCWEYQPVWSPDGRYVTLIYVEGLKTLRLFPVLLVEAATGKTKVVQEFPKNMRQEGAGMMTAAAFSKDSKTLLYVLYTGDSVTKSRLMAYDIPSGRTNVISDLEEVSAACGGNPIVVYDLSVADDGSLIFRAEPSNKAGSKVFVRMQRGFFGPWQTTCEEISNFAGTRVQEMQYAGGRIAYTTELIHVTSAAVNAAGSTAKPMTVLGIQFFSEKDTTKGLNTYYFIDKNDRLVKLELAPEEKQDVANTIYAYGQAHADELQLLFGTALSPSGRYLLALTFDFQRSDKFMCYLIDIPSGSIEPVRADGLSDALDVLLYEFRLEWLPSGINFLGCNGNSALYTFTENIR